MASAVTTTAPVGKPDQSDQPKIKVYWLNESRSQRLIWLLEELRLDYEIEIFYRDADMLAPPELKTIHPLGKAPILSIHAPGAERPLILAESGFIFQYLSDHLALSSPNPNLVPKKWKPGQEGKIGGETEAWLRYQHLLHYTEGSLQPALLVGIILEILGSKKIPFPIRPITGFVAGKFFKGFVIPHMSTDLEFLEGLLETAGSLDGGEGTEGEGGYICGKHLTAADILLSFSLILVKERIGKVEGAIFEKYPRVWKYLERLESEEGFKRAERRVKEEEQKAGGKK